MAAKTGATSSFATGKGQPNKFCRNCRLFPLTVGFTLSTSAHHESLRRRYPHSPPGFTNSGPDHWQTRWEQKLSTARRVEQAQWSKPVRDDWIARIAEEVNACDKPVVLVAHSLAYPPSSMRSAFPQRSPAPSWSRRRCRQSRHPPETSETFGPYPREPLPFPSMTIASRNDPFGSYEHAMTSPTAGLSADRCRRVRPYQQRIRPRAVARGNDGLCQVPQPVEAVI
ncbi:serine hydrolase domain-containing protein [Ditylenchus destructor]|uniref:Serine hydrolase domain-containing protein n=1 Tax=Ditylenchus destructor TaxID=166010 RepID=A0AAD4MEQ2_9BILA|nr:serine hydrolase domain-containing protein [Ditylenchus destructor]